MAVACAAMFVPFRVFLKPSIPHDRINCGAPLASQIVMIVLFGETRMLQMGISLKGTPPKRVVGVSTSGKKRSFLKVIKLESYILLKSNHDG